MLTASPPAQEKVFIILLSIFVNNWSLFYTNQEKTSSNQYANLILHIYLPHTKRTESRKYTQIFKCTLESPTDPNMHVLVSRWQHANSTLASPLSERDSTNWDALAATVPSTNHPACVYRLKFASFVWRVFQRTFPGRYWSPMPMMHWQQQHLEQVWGGSRCCRRETDVTDWISAHLNKMRANIQVFKDVLKLLGTQWPKRHWYKMRSNL